MPCGRLPLLSALHPGSAGKESACNAEDLGWEDPLEKEMATHSGTLARKFHGWRSLVGYSPWGCKESDMTKQLHLLNITRTS